MSSTLSRTDLIASYFTLAGAGVGAPARFGFAERVAAAAAAGFAAVGLQCDDYAAARARGLSDAEMRRVLADHCSRVAEIEFLFDWAHGGEVGVRARKLEDRLYAMAEAFEPGYVFGFFCGMMVLQLIWVKTMVPETKGVPLEDMQRKLGIVGAGTSGQGGY